MDAQWQNERKGRVKILTMKLGIGPLQWSNSARQIYVYLPPDSTHTSVPSSLPRLYATELQAPDSIFPTAGSHPNRDSATAGFVQRNHPRVSLRQGPTSSSSRQLFVTPAPVQWATHRHDARPGGSRRYLGPITKLRSLIRALNRIFAVGGLRPINILNCGVRGARYGYFGEFEEVKGEAVQGEARLLEMRRFLFSAAWLVQLLALLEKMARS